MNKAQLLDLTERVKLVAGVELPTIIGAPAFKAVIEQIGLASSFQETHGYYADAVGLATVVLSAGWQERLVPLTDEAGKTQACCLEVHDTCVSKLMAGREKDFTFIKELLDRGLADMETFTSRAETISDTPQSAALRPRLERLEVT